eukprot:6413875-Alexandrium_andersonii.AAC.1
MREHALTLSHSLSHLAGRLTVVEPRPATAKTMPLDHWPCESTRWRSPTQSWRIMPTSPPS